VERCNRWYIVTELFPRRCPFYFFPYLLKGISTNADDTADDKQPYVYITLHTKNVTALACSSFGMHEQISVIFGRIRSI